MRMTAHEYVSEKLKRFVPGSRWRFDGSYQKEVFNDHEVIARFWNTRGGVTFTIIAVTLTDDASVYADWGSAFDDCHMWGWVHFDWHDFLNTLDELP